MLSIVDAAANVPWALAQPMNCKELIEAMTAKGLSASPGGQTPWATLYFAIAREIRGKAKEAGIVKSERGKFATKE